MSLESGRKFGYYASLINVIMPIVAIINSSSNNCLHNCHYNNTNRQRLSWTGILGFQWINRIPLHYGSCRNSCFIMFMYSMYKLIQLLQRTSNFQKCPICLHSEPSFRRCCCHIRVRCLTISTFRIFLDSHAIICHTYSLCRLSLHTSVIIVVALAFGIVNGVLYMRAFNKLKRNLELITSEPQDYSR